MNHRGQGWANVVGIAILVKVHQYTEKELTGIRTGPTAKQVHTNGEFEV